MTAHENPAKIETRRTEENQNEILDNEIKTLLAWKAPGRPFKKRSKQYYLSSILIAMLVEIVLFLFAQYILMLVVASLLFMAFALASVPPRDFHYRISSEGIMIEEHFFLWKELYDFYFIKHDSEDTLHIGTEDFFPGEITLVLRGIDREHVKAVLLQFLPFREVVKPTFMEKSGDWLVRNFPLEKSSSS